MTEAERWLRAGRQDGDPRWRTDQRSTKAAWLGTANDKLKAAAATRIDRIFVALARTAEAESSSERAACTRRSYLTAREKKALDHSSHGGHRDQLPSSDIAIFKQLPPPEEDRRYVEPVDPRHRHFAARVSVEELEKLRRLRERYRACVRVQTCAREKDMQESKLQTAVQAQYVFASTSLVHRLKSKRSLNDSKQPTNSFSSASCRSSTLPGGGSVPVRSAHASRKASTRAVPSAMSCGGSAAATAPSASASVDSAATRQARRG